MIFGKIEYLNLLPFHVFMKRYTKGSSAKMAMEYKKNVPAKINHAFVSRRVDAAFISSVVAQKYKHVQLGIIAKKDVRSVLLIQNTYHTTDKESASSNLLASILGLQGKVLIGDKALRYALKHNDYIDLAQMWHERYQLPFVFALLCYHKDYQKYKKIEKAFLKRKVKIPHYLLQKASQSTDVPAREILDYLTLISYELNTQAQKGLRKFYKELHAIKL